VLSQKLQPQDLVFIYTAGHGSEDMSQEPYLLTFDDSEFDAQMFCGHLALLPQHASLLIMMQQCYGAGFMSPVINAKDSKRIHADRVSFACASDGLSYADDDQMFSRFSWGWIAAHLDKDNEGKPLVVPVAKDNSGFIEASEAYRYAKKVGAPPLPDHSRTRNRPGEAKDIRLA